MRSEWHAWAYTKDGALAPTPILVVAALSNIVYPDHDPDTLLFEPIYLIDTTLAGGAS